MSGSVAFQPPVRHVDVAHQACQQQALQPCDEILNGSVPLQRGTPDGVPCPEGVAVLLQPPEQAAVQHERPDDVRDLHDEIPVVVPRKAPCAEHSLQFQPVTLLLLERLLDLPARPAYPVKHLQGAFLLLVQEDGRRVEQGDVLPLLVFRLFPYDVQGRLRLSEHMLDLVAPAHPPRHAREGVVARDAVSRPGHPGLRLRLERQRAVRHRDGEAPFVLLADF